MIIGLFITSTILLFFSLLSILLLYLRNRSRAKELLEVKQEHLKLDNLYRAMLEITQAVVGTENPEDLYSIILEKAINAIPHANVGSVIIRDEKGMFRCIAQKGFDEEKIACFSLALEETILWKYTGGKIEKTELIRDVSAIEDLEVKPLTVDPEEWSIRSSIAVPLFSEGQLKGVLHIDSRETDAFTEDDRRTMEQIRHNIEIAMQKYILYQRMVNMSRFDSLTGAYNRSYFMDQFANTLNKAERYNQRFTLLIFDINDLKSINDNYGHLAGDSVLQEFSTITLKKIRKTDTFARWGGDEFMGLFYEMNDQEIGEKIEDIRVLLSENAVQEEKPYLPPRFSYGHAFYPEEGNDFDKLLRIADSRMYINKRKMKKERRDQAEKKN